MNHSTTVTETVTTCDQYSWHGTTYTSSTSNARFTTLNSVGCDSVVTLHLTVYHSDNVIETVNACFSYTWNDSTYTISTTSPTYSTHNSLGCDSMTTLHLTVTPHLNAPSGLLPSNDSVITHGTIALKWNSVESATGYRLFVWPADESMPITPTLVTTHTSWLMSEYDNNQIYSWKVEAVNMCDTVPSPQQQFAIYKQPVLTLSTHRLEFGTATIGTTENQQFFINGYDLTAPITLTLMGSDASAFSLSTSTLNRWGGTVGVTYAPTLLQREFDAYVVVTSASIHDTVTLHALLPNYYVFTASVPDSILPPNNPVPITGRLTNLANEPQANVAVDIYLTVMGRTTVVTDTTDTQGQFGCTYTPRATESGYYEVGACLLGEKNRAILTSFSIPGISITTQESYWVVYQHDTLYGSIDVANRCNMTMSNIIFSAESLPNGMSIQFDTLTLAPFESSTVDYTIVGNELTAINEFEHVRIQALYGSETVGKFFAYYYCQKPIADLQLLFDTLICSAQPGKQKVVDLGLYNNTDNEFRDVGVMLPNGIEGMSLLHVDSLYNIAPRDSMYIPILLSFPNEMPLAPISGTMTVVAENTTSQQIPFTVNIVSESKGSLSVAVSNEFTYYNNGPRVSGAKVSLVGYYSLDTVASAVTDNTGIIHFDSIPEGYYNLYVSAPDNYPYSSVILIHAGKETFKEVHLYYQDIAFQFIVHQNDISDNYSVVLDAQFKTNVPKPVITIENTPINAPYDGSFGTFDIIMTNHGLVDAYDVQVSVTASDEYDFVPLYDKIDTLHALSSVTVPCNVRNRILNDAINEVYKHGNYHIDTNYYVTERTVPRLQYIDSIIYIPVTEYRPDSGEAIWIYDTVMRRIPHVVVDTLYDSTMVGLDYYDTLQRISLLRINWGKQPNTNAKSILKSPSKMVTKEYTVSEYCKKIVHIHTLAHHRCTWDGHIDPTIAYTTDYAVSFEECHYPTPDTIIPMIYPLPIVPPCPPFCDSISPQDGPGIRPRISPLPSINLPKIPKIDVRKYLGWECVPCWYTVLKNAGDCLMQFAPSRYYLPYAAVMSYDDIAEGDNLSGNIGATEALLSLAPPLKMPLAITHCLYNLLNTFVYCSAYITEEVDNVPKGAVMRGSKNMSKNDSGSIGGRNARKSNSSDEYFQKLMLVSDYMDNLNAIYLNILGETSSAYSTHPEVPMQLVRYLVTNNNPTVQDMSQCYDNTDLLIDTATLRRYIDRWNRTLTYSYCNWNRPEQVPEGFSRDFYYPDPDVQSRLAEIDTTVATMGYSSIWDMLFTSIQEIQGKAPKQSLCAGVKLQFSQEVAMTREAFEGVLSVNNPNDTAALRDLNMIFTVTDTLGHDCSDKFDISITSMEGVDTTGSIMPGSTGTVTVRFVPLMSAAPTNSIPYLFGGSIDYTNPFSGVAMSDQLSPVTLMVSPSPHLMFDYFMPHNIIGDDPMTTPTIEASVPATIGVRVLNNGAGKARNVRLSSLSMQVTENKLGLAVDLSLLNTMRNGQDLSQPLSDITIGDMESGQTHTLEYYFHSSLMGTLTVDSVHVIHNSSINDRDMSLVETAAHRLVKTVLQYGSEADSIHDFLTDDILNGLNHPDSLFFSDGTATSVGMVNSTTFNHYVTQRDTVVQVTVDPSDVGWQYGYTEDPGRGKYDIVSCIRDDNTVIPLDNIWLTFVDLPDNLDPIYVNRLHLVDTLSAKRVTTYNVTFRTKDSILNVDTITATANPTTGGIVMGVGYYPVGNTCTLRATPMSGYQFLNWTEGNTVVSTNATYSFTVTSSRTLTANFTPVVICGITVDDLPYTDNFDSYSSSTSAKTGVQPDCWTLAHQYVTMTDEYKPMVYYASANAHSGNYSLLLNKRGIYAMPEFVGDVSTLQLSFYLKQSQTKYQLQVGVMSNLGNANTFIPVATINNSSTGIEYVEVDFASYTGDGHYIAFRNTLASGHTGNYSCNYIDDLTLDVRPQQCGIAITDLPYTDNFDSYTSSTTAKTGVEPDCWTLAHQDVSMTDEYKPMVYYASSNAHSGNYALLLNKRGIYVMPEFYGDVNTLQLSFYLKQNQAKYQLQIGVMSTLTNASTFVPVTTINNSTTGIEAVTVDFSSYTGNGHYIAFRNVLASGNTGDYSCNYIDDLTLKLRPATTCTGINVNDLPYYEEFDSITTSTTTKTGVEPPCWTLVHQDVNMTDAYKPMIYYSPENAYTGDYSLILNKRCIYAMPAYNGDITQVSLFISIKQPQTKYQLDIGVMSDLNDTSTFESVGIIDNTSTDYQFWGVDFLDYTGDGHYIAFRNILAPGYTGDYSINYIDHMMLEPLVYYDVTALANPAEGGTITGAGSYMYRRPCTLTATPNENYTFANWTYNDTVVSTNPSYSFYVYDDCTLTANFTYIPPTYTVTVTASPSEGGTITGAGEYTRGSTCTLTATPASGYTFANWTVGTTVVSSNATYSFTVTSDSTLTANFAPIVNCGISIDDLPYTDNFDHYTTSTTAKTGVEPPCWTLAKRDVNMTDEYKPMIYYSSANAHSGNYSLILNKRGIYAMPEFNGDISTLQLSMYLKQPQTKYQLQVGVMSSLSNANTFVPVATINNSTTDIEQVTVDFASYTGNGHYIAFRNTLASGQTGNYSCNYIDDITLDVHPQQCGIAIADLPYSDNFDTYTTATTAKTGVEPDCWTLAKQDVTMTDEYKPMIYYASANAHSDNYALLLNKRGIYAMPEFEGNVNTLQLSMYLKQSATKYQLQVGVMSNLDNANTFVPVATINNSTTGIEKVTVDFASYMGDGHFIAFRNILASGNTGNFSCNYIDDLRLETRCSIYPDELPFTECFDDYTTSTTDKTGVAPDCWTLVHQDVIMTDEYKPMIYYNTSCAHSASYSLILNKRGIYAMPAYEGDVKDLQLSFYVRQTRIKYQLQVGVMSDLSDVSTFVPLATFNNSSTTASVLRTVNFSSYTGNGHYIAFHNILAAGQTGEYSCNYIDDLTLSIAEAKIGMSDDSYGVEAPSHILTLYPNPTTGKLTMDADEDVVRVDVFDYTGRRVAVFEGQTTLDLSHLADGLYTLRITLPDRIEVRRVVKQ